MSEDVNVTMPINDALMCLGEESETRLDVEPDRIRFWKERMVYEREHKREELKTKRNKQTNRQRRARKEGNTNRSDAWGEYLK